jgi:diaminopimelate epimerase
VTTGLAFSKYEGIGNDFIVIDAADERAVDREQAQRLCDRHFGIGADGVLLVLPPNSDACAARMRVLNADGSVPEMCGNGLRCVALRVAQLQGATSGVFRIETDAGLRTCEVERSDGRTLVTVDMGLVTALGAETIRIDGRSLQLELADAGNPHAVLFGRFDRQEIEHLGPRIEKCSVFPRGANVEFATASTRGIELTVWERGVGLTLACGTGACATVAVAARAGFVDHGVPVAVHLPGGMLTVTVRAGGATTMRGPARHVFSGTMDLAGSHTRQG